MSSSFMRRVGFYSAMGFGYWQSRLGEALHLRRLRMRRHAAGFTGHGLEIGGPSGIFGAHGLFPIYRHCANLDNVLFSHRTLWEGNVRAGDTFVYRSHHAPGRQFVMEGAALDSLPPERYDFVVSSHMLEHSANPIGALLGWRRLLKDDGMLLLVLPHRDGTFDRYRPITELRHLIEDFEADMGEDDRTHFAEILRLHDLRRDPAQASRAEFERWIEDNHSNRGAHHHVFDLRHAVEMVDYAGLQIIDAEASRPFHIFLLATKVVEGAARDNAKFLDTASHRYRRSPFGTDRG